MQVSALVAIAALFWFAGIVESVTGFKQSAQLCANLTGSAPLWSGPTGNIGELFEIEPSGGNIFYTPVVDVSGNFYLVFSSAIVHGVNGATGALLWQYNNAFWGSFGAPILTSYGVLLVGNQKGVLALYTQTGKRAWSFEDGSTTDTTPIQTYDPTNSVFITRGTSSAGTLTAYNGVVGSPVWSIATSSSQCASLVVSGDLVQVCPELYDSASSIVITSFVGGTGAISWQELAGSGTSLTVCLLEKDDNGNVYVGYLDLNFVVSIKCYTPNGSQKWMINNPLDDANPFSIVGPVNLYLASNDAIIAYSLGTGLQGSFMICMCINHFPWVNV